MWIKICGVTRVEDAETVVHSGADAIGFNFFPDSRRCVSIPIASALAEAARQSAVDLPLVDLVGVFVNAKADAIRTVVQEVGLSVIQVHGDETVAHVSEIHRLCPDVAIVRAFRVDLKNTEHTLNDIDRLSALVPLAAILLDALGRKDGFEGYVNLRVDVLYDHGKMAGGIVYEYYQVGCLNACVVLCAVAQLF